MLYPQILGADVSSYMSNPRVKAFLDLIARAEGTYNVGDNGYNILYGYERFTDYSKHPNRAISKGGLTSTAAGRYQFLKKTWDGVKAALSLPDFGPASQDKGAVYLVQQRGALNDVINGNVQAAIQKVNKEWASFPGSPYGQGTRSLTQMLTWYAADLAKYNGGGNTITNSAGMFEGIEGEKILITLAAAAGAYVIINLMYQ